MKKVMFTILILLLAGGGYYAYSTHMRDQKRANRQAGQVVTVERGTIEDTVEATGIVQPLNRVEIKPPIAGRVESLKVDEGATVKAGEILGWMSSTDRAAILDAARAKGPEELKRWQDSYKPTPIVAPLSGTIILRNVVVGQTIDAATVIFAMSDKLIVKANVDETDIGRITPDMPASITLDSYPAAPIKGKVFQILHEGINVSNVITYPVKIEPETVPPFFRSQMTANITLISSKKDNVLLLPSAAVSTNAQGEKQVLVPVKDGKPMPRIVQTGLSAAETIEIVSGLEEGDKVLLANKRYIPQQAAASSPLVMSGPKQQQGGQAPRKRSSGAN